jgi:hypothetical protein
LGDSFTIAIYGKRFGKIVDGRLSEGDWRTGPSMSRSFRASNVVCRRSRFVVSVSGVGGKIHIGRERSCD